MASAITKAGDIAAAFYRMSDLPKLRKLANLPWATGYRPLDTIDRALDKAGAVNAHLFAAVDELLVDLLTQRTEPADGVEKNHQKPDHPRD